MDARATLLEGIRLSEAARSRFPHEQRFHPFHAATTGSLPTVEQFLADVRAFKALIDIEPRSVEQSEKIQRERDGLLRKIADLMRKLEK